MLLLLTPPLRLRRSVLRALPLLAARAASRRRQPPPPMIRDRRAPHSRRVQVLDLTTLTPTPALAPTDGAPSGPMRRVWTSKEVPVLCPQGPHACKSRALQTSVHYLASPARLRRQQSPQAACWTCTNSPATWGERTSACTRRTSGWLPARSSCWRTAPRLSAGWRGKARKSVRQCTRHAATSCRCVPKQNFLITPQRRTLFFCGVLPEQALLMDSLDFKGVL